MEAQRVFVSHSSQNKEFAGLVVEALRKPDSSAWIDSEQIVSGDDILERLGQGLQIMDALVLLISRAALDSEWVTLEVKYAQIREIGERRALIKPFIIDDTPISAVPWFLQTRNLIYVTADAQGAERVADDVRKAIERHTTPVQQKMSGEFSHDERIDALITPVHVGDWEAAQDAAISMLQATDEQGNNELFEALLRYHDCPNEDLRWGAILTVECFAQLAPWLVTHELLARMASHPDFSIRSSAASICLDLAQFAPDSVPSDILIRLARPDEDWYVMDPATAALKTLVRTRPALMRVFFLRLHSPDPNVRQHAAYALAGIAAQEPEILDQGALASELSRLAEVGDKVATEAIAEALSKVKQAEHVHYLKYGL